MEVNDLSAIVTGGASGLGLATVQALCAAGANVTLLDMGEARVDEAANASGALGLVCDVTDEAAIKQALLTAEKQQGPVRINVNCAGIAGSFRLVNKQGPVDMAQYRKVIDINLHGSVSVMTKCAARMMQQEALAEGERGVIINTSSITAFEGQIGQGAYAASKGALASLSLPAAREFAPWGIRVMAIAPGLFATPIVEGISDETVQAIIDDTLYPKRFGQPEEFAELVLAICHNRMFNGTTLRLDAGVRLH